MRTESTEEDDEDGCGGGSAGSGGGASLAVGVLRWMSDSADASAVPSWLLELIG
jgi:hypothetical protein